jgi:hypothetical protein
LTGSDDSAVEARLGSLASGDLAPHMASMTSTENRQTHASDHAAAIARWDDEGGAPRTAPRRNEAVTKTPALGMIDNKQRNRIKPARPKQ